MQLGHISYISLPTLISKVRIIYTVEAIKGVYVFMNTFEIRIN